MASTTQNMRGFQLRTSRSLPCVRSLDGPSLETDCTLTFGACSGEKYASLASSPIGTPRKSRFGRVDPLLEYLQRSWGEPTPDCSPKGSFATTRAAPNPCRFESNTTREPEDDDGNDEVALEPDSLAHTPDLFQLCFSHRDDTSEFQQLSEAAASSNGNGLDPRVLDASSESNSLPVQHTFGDDLAAEIQKMFTYFLEQMLTAVEAAVRERSSAVTTYPAGEYAPLANSVPRTCLLGRHGFAPAHSEGVGKDTISRVTSGSSPNVNICYHWKSKGVCWYEDRCKFLHPNAKRGVGKSRGRTKKDISLSPPEFGRQP